MNKDELKKKQEEQKRKQFKEQYFDFYDDVKSHTHRRYDW